MDSPIQLLNNWGQTDQIYNLTVPSFPSVPLFSSDYIKNQRPFFLFINLNAV